MTTKQEVREGVVFLVKGHYAFEDYEMDGYFTSRRLSELAIDSIGVVEFFLIMEDGFDLQEKLSDKIDMGDMADKTVGEFMEVVVDEVWKMLQS